MYFVHYIARIMVHASVCLFPGGHNDEFTRREAVGVKQLVEPFVELRLALPTKLFSF
jgi:hypothetical protein